MKEFKTWGDFSKHYNLVLFNQAPDIDGVLDEWMETHQCEEKCEVCQCEVCQWYGIEVSDDDADWLNKNYNMDIFYSDILGLFILPVYHYGTGWDYVNLTKITIT